MIQSSTDAIDLPLIHQGKVRDIYAIDPVQMHSCDGMMAGGGTG